MTKINWNREKRAKIMHQLDDESWKKRKLYSIPLNLSDLFEKAVENTKGTKHFRAAWSLRSQYLKRGFLSQKQGAYLKWMANLNATAHPGC